jgi:hypothetical protein
MNQPHLLMVLLKGAFVLFLAFGRSLSFIAGIHLRNSLQHSAQLSSGSHLDDMEYYKR